MAFWGFIQKSNPFISTFIVEYESINGLLTLIESHMSGKIVVLEL